MIRGLELFLTNVIRLNDETLLAYKTPGRCGKIESSINSSNAFFILKMLHVAAALCARAAGIEPLTLPHAAA